nr:immunoglobulin heavy chain junction region [Mus musculus]MBK4197952.1 immunoglobulin heavy chain junction region [Mus musculus]MBK4197953.1 immunoglobulin heavy chain junction region [Mus musculus]MBK4197954.1 immunoglobulin heavy chain junction region [Mus musculus]
CARGPTVVGDYFDYW